MSLSLNNLRLQSITPAHQKKAWGSATSGGLFRGLQTRKFSHQTSISPHSKSSRQASHVPIISKLNCRYWSITTTIFPPSEALIRQTGWKDWCLLVVLDKKSSELEYTRLNQSNVIVFSVQEQIWYSRHFSSFMNQLPWNHFARKNAGFLFAIHHGAQAIWDFDDDNVLKNGMKLSIPRKNQICYADYPIYDSSLVYNSYVSLGAPTLPVWPRGFPLTDILSDYTWNSTFQRVFISCNRIGVVQSLADNDPDVDAIFRLTRFLPFEFRLPVKKLATTLIPLGTFASLNAQACLFMHSSFWMLLLPITVHGRVSDIWRGYFGQRLLLDLDLHVAVTSPVVNQFRNPHNYLADFDAELPLYSKSGALIAFLREWEGTADTFPGRVDQLYIALYEREFIEIEDVFLSRSWMSSLSLLSYKFPKLKSPSYRLSENHSRADAPWTGLVTRTRTMA